MAFKLNIVMGSTRPSRSGPIVANWVKTFANEHDAFDATLVDLNDLGLPLMDEPGHPRMQAYEHAHTKRWSEITAAADAFIFLTPEYDFFPPASLINAIQVLFNEWTYKPAAIVSYGGVSGGLRAAQELRVLLSNMGVVPIPQTVPMPFFSKFIGDDGVFTPNEQMIEGTTLALNELAKWTGALKPLRQGA